MSDLLSRHETEQRVQCPYEPSHSIIAKRIQTHLTRCRRQHPCSEMVTCIYNAQHRIPKMEEAFHLEHCQNRQNLDKFAYLPEDVDFDKYPVPTVEMEFTETWDDNATTYNPTAYCESHPVLRTVTTLSAAARREFAHSERLRLQDLQDIYQRTPTHNAMPHQQSQVSAIANRANQIDEDDPYRVQMLMNQISNNRHENSQINQPQTSVWGNSSRATSQEVDFNDFPPLGGNGAAGTNRATYANRAAGANRGVGAYKAAGGNYRGRGRGRR